LSLRNGLLGVGNGLYQAIVTLIFQIAIPPNSAEGHVGVRLPLQVAVSVALYRFAQSFRFIEFTKV
jgi:hypothetical protein